MFSILKYVLKNGLRDRLYAGLLLTIIIAFAVAIFLGSTMMVEKNQSSLIYALGSFRTILALGMILFVGINVSRAFENKEIEFILSKPVSRERFIIGYVAGFFVANFLIMLPVIAAILFIFEVNKIGFLFWNLSVLVENLLVISFCLLSCLILKNSFLAILSSIAFYTLSRMMGLFVMAIDLPQNYNDVKNNTVAMALKFLSAIFPRLDLFAQSSWPTYGVIDNSTLYLIFFQSIIYLPLLIFMAFHDFKKKQF